MHKLQLQSRKDISDLPTGDHGELNDDCMCTCTCVCIGIYVHAYVCAYISVCTPMRGRFPLTPKVPTGVHSRCTGVHL